ncbi:MAG: bifunctional glutamate--cysteine ligase GshA/glutathione synthetase GshB [Simkaniaceae bacterium]|nr:bifunctional glutamate--cysteine ligase GshA/glutathione synthetase GshB [Simkaniaceae bacterium]
MTKDFSLSKEPHPKSLGEKLTHPLITTDFAEMQIEWTTPTFHSHAALMRFFKDLSIYTQKKVPNEYFWPLSMPPKLPKKCQDWVAKYGNSHSAKKKESYRHGLCKAYGSHMQMISGFHYNFSMRPAFWKALHKERQSNKSCRQFQTDTYLGLIRNYIRDGWIITYLFGSSPSSDPSFKDLPEFPYATSLRTSEHGYQSKSQDARPITFNSVSGYVKEIREAIARGQLQIENEHYSLIRPKCLPREELNQTDAIATRGIEYVELRALDLDPFSPLGISKKTLDFLHLFLLHLLLSESPNLTHKAHKKSLDFQHQVAIEGRKMELKSKAEPIFTAMRPLAIKLGMVKLLDEMWLRFEDPSKLPSQIIASNDFLELGATLCKEHYKTLSKGKLEPSQRRRFDTFTKNSIELFDLLERAEKMEASTRVLIEEAIRRHVKVEILDKKACILRLGGQELVKQASCTSQDSYITPLLMENKHVTKLLLDEQNIRTPLGMHFNSLTEALSHTPPSKTVVVKPNTTNYGLGVELVEPKEYKAALKRAFAFGESVLVEDFISGREYRFLVVSNKVAGVVRRDPASVIGNGHDTIKTLAKGKKRPIKLGPDEKKHLLSQNLTAESIPKEGEKVFLRFNSNVSTGGEAIDFTDQVANEYKRIAIRAAKSVGAKICGVDMIIKSPHKPGSRYAIIELNFNPVLYFHQEPDVGHPRNVAGAILDCIGFGFEPITKRDCC